jgi:hypothetical protein
MGALFQDRLADRHKTQPQSQLSSKYKQFASRQYVESTTVCYIEFSGSVSEVEKTVTITKTVF